MHWFALSVCLSLCPSALPLSAYMCRCLSLSMSRYLSPRISVSPVFLGLVSLCVSLSASLCLCLCLSASVPCMSVRLVPSVRVLVFIAHRFCRWLQMQSVYWTPCTFCIIYYTECYTMLCHALQCASMQSNDICNVINQSIKTRLMAKKNHTADSRNWYITMLFDMLWHA